MCIQVQKASDSATFLYLFTNINIRLVISIFAATRRKRKFSVTCQFESFSSRKKKQLSVTAAYAAQGLPNNNVERVFHSSMRADYEKLLCSDWSR